MSNDHQMLSHPNRLHYRESRAWQFDRLRLKPVTLTPGEVYFPCKFSTFFRSSDRGLILTLLHLYFSRPTWASHCRLSAGVILITSDINRGYPQEMGITFQKRLSHLKIVLLVRTTNATTTTSWIPMAVRSVQTRLQEVVSPISSRQKKGNANELLMSLYCFVTVIETIRLG